MKSFGKLSNKAQVYMCYVAFIYMLMFYSEIMRRRLYSYKEQYLSSSTIPKNFDYYS